MLQQGAVHHKRYVQVTQDEIPIVLNELNDAAFNYIEKEHFEKALTLLIKSNGILEELDLRRSKRDKNLALVTF